MADNKTSESTASSTEERTVCFCHCVPLSTILATIRAGAKTFEEVQAKTACSTGCGGCEWDVKEVLAAELARSR